MKAASGAERIRYFEGQALLARDLSDDAAWESTLRGLHVRAVHDTWGIGLGFDVRRQGNSLLVGGGVAYDCHGREIVSGRTTELAIPLPDTPPEEPIYYDLVLSWHSSDGLRAGRDWYSRCFDGASPLEERPRWRWVRATRADLLADAVRLGEEIPVARVAISAETDADGGVETVISQPDMRFRRNAQGLVRPHIASGSETFFTTPNSERHAWSSTISTSNGGFTSTPYYFVTLTNNPFIDLALEPNFDDFTLATLRRMLGPFVTVRSRAVNQVVVDVRIALGGGLTNDFSARFAELPLRFDFNWVGIEPTGGCPPRPFFGLVTLLSPLIFTGGIFSPFRGDSG